MPKKVKAVAMDDDLDELVKEVETSFDDSKRDELVKASEDGYISEKVSTIKKASERTIDKLYKEYLSKRKIDSDIFLTGLLISQFASVLGGLDAIEGPEDLEDDLRMNELLKKDIESIVSTISPYIPILGIISGPKQTRSLSPSLRLKHPHQQKTGRSKITQQLTRKSASKHPT